VNNVIRVAALSMAMLSLGSVATVQAADANIAVVDIGKVLREIPQRKAIESKLKSEFDSRVREMQRMETEGQTLAAKLKKDESFMSADERTKSQRKLAELQADFNLKGQALQEDQRRRFNEEQQKVFEKIQTNVETIAKSEGYDMVLNRQAVVYMTDKKDISAKVIQQVSKGN
jgi:outer membrane protein